MQTKYKNIIIISFFLIATTFLIYFQTRNFDFIVFDDGKYVTNNSNIQNGINCKSIKWAFSSFYASNYHPLTWLSHMLDYGLHKKEAGEHHITNVIIHTINSLLLFFLLFKMTGAVFKSGFVAFLFALHPLHIESVVWISERKDLLCCFFCFASIYFYADYVQNKEIKKKTTYLNSLIFFLFALLSKPMSVTLPFVLMLFDFWPLKRKSDIFEFKFIKDKIPFLMGSFIFSIITIFAQQDARVYIDFNIRVSNAIISYFTYLYKTFIPIKLSILYMHPMEFFLFKTCFFSLLLIFLTFLFFHYRKKKPYLIVSWFFYLGVLFPTIGIIQVGGQATADRYTYIPLIGIFILFVWLFDDIDYKYKNFTQKLLPCLILPTLMFLSFKQISYWKNSSTLFNHTIKVTENINKNAPTNILIRNNLALILIGEGKLDEAHKILSDVKYTHPYLLNNIGRIFLKKKEYKKAIKNFEKSIAIGPMENSYLGLGEAYNAIEQKEKTIKIYEAVLLKKPDFNSVRNSLIAIYAKKASYKKMLRHLLYLHNQNPEQIITLDTIGATYGNLEKFDMALKYFLKALEKDPNNKSIQNKIKKTLFFKRNQSRIKNEIKK